FMLDGLAETDILEELELDVDEIATIDVIKLSGNAVIDEERLEEIIIETEELARRLEEKEERRAIEIEQIIEERRAEIEERREAIDRERARMEREVHERHREGLRFSGHDNDDWLSEQLLADGLVTDPGNFTFKITDKRLKVNGKNQSDEMHQRYMEYYQRRNGITFGDGTVISVNRKDN
ncbi:MAG: hypothetical protein AAFY48_16585, partial [Bacteroidota bacterium]